MWIYIFSYGFHSLQVKILNTQEEMLQVDGHSMRVNKVLVNAGTDIRTKHETFSKNNILALVQS